MPKKIAVIDGNSLMHRAYHAVPQTMNAPDGRPTNAVFGFVAMLLKFIDVAHPDAVICAFDAGRPAFRTKALEQYKAQRPPMDDDLKVQFPIIEELLEAMNVPVVRVKGWEGDDVLGTVARRDEPAGLRDAAGDGRQGRLPAGQRQDAHRHHEERHHRRGHLRPGRGGGALRRHAGAGARLPGAQGRLVRQHPRRARHRREDRGQAAAAVRVARRPLREPGRAQRQAARAHPRQQGRRVRQPRGGHHRVRPRLPARPGGGGLPLVRRGEGGGGVPEDPVQHPSGSRPQAGGQGVGEVAGAALVGARRAWRRGVCARGSGRPGGRDGGRGVRGARAGVPVQPRG